MHLIEVGLDHHTANVTLRERLAMSAEALPGVFERLREISREVAAISTCNRVELYLMAGHPDRAEQRVIELLAERSRLSVDELRAALTVRRDEDAICHLFRVASGLESMIVGEPEITGQVRTARSWPTTAARSELPCGVCLTTRSRSRARYVRTAGSAASQSR